MKIFTRCPKHAASVVLVLLAAGCASSPDSPPPTEADPSRAALDPIALETLLRHAAEQHSSAVAVAVDGEVLAMEGTDEPTSAMSASKSIASLAVGFLVDDGVLRLDDPVATWVPEWRDTPRAAITIRHLMNHTSGLDPTRADLETGNIADHAIASPLLFDPGTRFQYNNNAVDLLAVIVGRAANQPMDALLEKRLFAPLGIRDASWVTDVAGVPFAAGELRLRPSALLAIGQLLADAGVWSGERLLSEEWIAISTARSQEHVPSYGLLWWREGDFRLSLTRGILDRWRDHAAPADILAAVAPLEGRTFASYADFQELLVGCLGNEDFERWRDWLRSTEGVGWSEQVQVGPQRGFSARGWLGQFLVVVPETRTVAVRMRAIEQEDLAGGPERDAFPTFPAEVLALKGDR